MHITLLIASLSIYFFIFTTSHELIKNIDFKHKEIITEYVLLCVSSHFIPVKNYGTNYGSCGNKTVSRGNELRI